MKEGNHFKVPENREEFLAWWNGSERLSPDMVPDWLKDMIRSKDTKLKEWRYAGNSSWECVDPDERGDSEPEFPGKYFEELEFMGALSGVIVEGDEGDGCVHHVYLRRDVEWRE